MIQVPIKSSMENKLGYIKVILCFNGTEWNIAIQEMDVFNQHMFEGKNQVPFLMGKFI